MAQRRFDAEIASLFAGNPARSRSPNSTGPCASVSGGYRTRFLPMIGVDWIALAPLSQAARRKVALVLDGADSGEDAADYWMRPAGLPVEALLRDDAPGDVGASPDPDGLAYAATWGHAHALGTRGSAADAGPDAGAVGAGPDRRNPRH